MKDVNPANMLTSRNVAANTIWNLLGQGGPLIVAALAIPILIHKLGVDRFGVLTLAWVLVGYFTLFDLGLGRALTKLLAERLALNTDEDIVPLIWTALSVMLVLGIACAAALCICSSILVHRVLRVPPFLQRETVLALYPLALSVPLVTMTSGLRGILEAHHRFRVLSAVRLGMGFYTYLGPLLVVLFSNNLVSLVLALFAGRICSWAIHLKLCLSLMPKRTYGRAWNVDALKSLLKFGGWITVSNLVDPLLIYLDRFMIGTFISVAAVSYYAAPFEMVTKLWLVPGSLCAVLFPAFSATARVDNGRMICLYRRATKSLLFLLFPVVLTLIVFAPQILHYWLGGDFAYHSSTILRWLAVGVFVNSLGYVPFALLQAADRPDLTCKLNLIETPAYCIALWWVIQRYGIAGAACIWTIRLSVNAAILFLLCRRFVRVEGSFAWGMPLLAGFSLASLLTGALLQGTLFKASFLLIALAIFLSAAWSIGLNSEDRSALRTVFRTFSVSQSSS